MSTPEALPRTAASDESVITQIQLGLAPLVPRVLIVDDDEIAIERLRDLVAAAGYEVAAASSGEAALAELEREFAPIVILDRNMPGMDGLALCRAIREGQRYPGYVYLMLCTAHDTEDEVLTGLNAGADDYISKRVSGAQLLARLATARRILALEHSLRQAIEERRRLSMTDSLTDAHNRRYFMSHLRRELKRTRRFGGELGVVVFDVDHFKHVNDRYGHAAGDAVLVEFVRRARECLPREYDWCARIGGEEFAVVLPQTPLEGSAVVAEKIRLAVAGVPVPTSAGMIDVTVSAGVSGVAAFADRDAVTVEQILRRADDCMYASKYNGRNQVTVDESNEARQSRPRTLQTLMYIDDDPDIRGIVELALGLDPELQVMTSDGGERALVKMRVERPDLVLLDVMMPHMDGPTLLKRMRADADLREIPVIFMTAKSSPDELKRLRELSSIGVIAKPFDPMALVGQVKALWSSK